MANGAIMLLGGEIKLKKLLSLVLVIALVFGCNGLIACGSDEKEVAESQESEEETKETEEEKEASTVSSGDGITWKDMPIYSGAKEIAKGAWAIPPAEEEDWSEVEWRYYESKDSSSDVTKFYKSEMPDNGWQEIMWMDAGEMSWAFYQKNDEQDGAMIWVTADNGNAIIALMRATE